MKKIFYLLLSLFFITQTSFAINWISLETPTGKIVELDKDSIKEKNGYYFYNIKITTKLKEVLIVTMQSAIKHPFCARIKYYTPSEYANLNGDYNNITINATQKLEPVTFESRAHTAYKEVQKIITGKNIPQITF